MRLCWLTDIHLDFVRDPQKVDLAHSIAATRPDLVMLSGDIAVAPTLQDELELLAGHIPAPIHYVLGNHDFYRGSIDEVRAECRRHAHANYLHGAAPVRLTASTCLVGVDGWGDGRFGRPRDSDLVFTDWIVIEEFVAIDGANDAEARLRLLRELGDESAERLRESLEQAVRDFEHVLILTHVPPFDTAAGNNGSNMAKLWIPWLGCAATGAVIEEIADAHPRVTFEVLCGHTHVARVVHPRPNVVSRTGHATYRKPSVQRVWDL